MIDRIAGKLAAGMRRSVRPGVVKLRDFVLGRPSARKLLAEVKSIDSLVADGRDPLHAAYLHGQNYLSVFSELACRLPEFDAYRAIVAEAEDDYVPGWPPMSPVSVSFFTDRRFAEAQARSDERARRTYEKIDALRDETARTYVRRDVYDADRRHDTGTEEAMRIAQDVASRLNCPVRPAE